MWVLFHARLRDESIGSTTRRGKAVLRSYLPVRFDARAVVGRGSGSYWRREHGTSCRVYYARRLSHT